MLTDIRGKNKTAQNFVQRQKRLWSTRFQHFVRCSSALAEEISLYHLLQELSWRAGAWGMESPRKEETSLPPKVKSTQHYGCLQKCLSVCPQMPKHLKTKIPDKVGKKPPLQQEGCYVRDIPRYLHFVSIRGSNHRFISFFEIPSISTSTIQNTKSDISYLGLKWSELFPHPPVHGD